MSCFPSVMWRNLEAHVQEEDYGLSVAIWLYRHEADGLWVLGSDGAWYSHSVGTGFSADPTYRMKREVFAAILAAASDFERPPDAQAKHLADAISVRDRLLALVERA